jgi:hypothetical protein
VRFWRPCRRSGLTSSWHSGQLHSVSLIHWQPELGAAVDGAVCRGWPHIRRLREPKCCSELVCKARLMYSHMYIGSDVLLTLLWTELFVQNVAKSVDIHVDVNKSNSIFISPVCTSLISQKEQIVRKRNGHLKCKKGNQHTTGPNLETRLDTSPHLMPGYDHHFRPENRPKCKHWSTWFAAHVWATHDLAYFRRQIYTAQVLSLSAPNTHDRPRALEECSFCNTLHETLYGCPKYPTYSGRESAWISTYIPFIPRFYRFFHMLLWPACPLSLFDQIYMKEIKNSGENNGMG